MKRQIDIQDANWHIDRLLQIEQDFRYVLEALKEIIKQDKTRKESQ